MAKKTIAQLEGELNTARILLEKAEEEKLQLAKDIGRLKADLEKTVPLKNENVTLKDRIVQRDEQVNNLKGEISGLKYAIDMMATGLSS